MIEVTTYNGAHQKFKGATARVEIPQDNFLELASIGYPWELVQETDSGFVCILSILAFGGSNLKLYSELGEEVFWELQNCREMAA